MTALSYGGAPGVAVLGGDLDQLRRRGGRWRLRDWRLRTKLTAVLLVPLLLAGALGGIRVLESLGDADDLNAMQQQVLFAQKVAVTVHDLQAERHLAAAALAAGEGADRARLNSQTQQVDLGITALRAPESGAEHLDGAAAAAYSDALVGLETLPGLRQAALTPGSDANQLLAGYSDAIGGLLGLTEAVLVGAEKPLAGSAEGVESLILAKEQISLQHAVLLPALVTNTLPGEQQAALRTADARMVAAIDDFRDAVPPEQSRLYDETVTGDGVAARTQLLTTVLDQALQNAPLAVVPGDWDVAAAETADRIRQVEATLLDSLVADIAALRGEARDQAVRDAAVVGVLLLLAIGLLVQVVRSLLIPLRTLRTSAFDVADRRLPEEVEQLRAAGAVEEITVEPVPVFTREEIGQVARAFDTVHVQAVRLAAEQAILRSTVNDIFLNLAGRSQGLVERQLKLIDELERGEQDPDQLSNLFELDHLATRMRRNSENLLVLAGGQLRRTSERMTVLDLLRAAISEIEQYRRVTLRRPPAASVSGPVVNDLVHLLAELLDNAAAASPPDTPVTMTSTLTDDGYLQIEITDSGTGLPPGELHAINERLASPPLVDGEVSRQMGLFVVSRLAARHRIRVRLRQQYGQFGITASVLVPPDVVRRETEEPSLPAAAGPHHGPGHRDAEHAPEPVSGHGTDAAPDHVIGRGRQSEPPLQVSVVRSGPDSEQPDPTSVSLPRRPERSAEQEWQELFGGGGVADTGRPTPPGPGSRYSEPGYGEPGYGEPSHRHTDPPARYADPPARHAAAPSGRHGAPGRSDQGFTGGPIRRENGQVSEKIFEAMVSAWFREHRPPPVGDTDNLATPPTGFPNPLTTTPEPLTEQDWQSAADEGWNAARALDRPVETELTPSGLPRRTPRAHLVPGAAPTSFGPAPASRSPDEVRGRLSSYQRGLREGRHARRVPDD